ncbi:flagellar basal body L-ring protein FlgH [candidate division KSB1 bacterium]|nr:flagellar basal body L-ring protein FlgH [candidate division KSB1 bacterium]
MKYRIIKLLVFAIVLTGILGGFAFAGQASGNFQFPKGGLIADVRAKKIGDIVTIIVNENAQASNANNAQTNTQSQIDATGQFGNSFLRNLTGTISAESQNQFTGSGQTSSSGSFVTQITATIIEIKEDGNFLIRGTREVDTNGEKVVTIVEGVIRPADITRDNFINSSKIADARIYHQGTGIVTQSQNPGLIMRILNWIF